MELSTVEQLREALQAGLSATYRVERLLGEGGMALVFAAHDLRHDRAVAIKVLRPEIAEAVGAERFLREIRLTAQLQHPHILSLYDSGALDRLLYYVMPLIEGESLRHRLQREHQLPVEDTIGLVRAVASALEYAHRRGILHRDVKPENILLHDGQPVLADFGVALVADRETHGRLTGTGLSVGTPSYMSPEQVSGERRLDARTDEYALACVAYECLVGEPPFTGATVQAIVAAALTEAPRSIALRRPAVPSAVAATIHRALERLPPDRFESVQAFADALAAAPQQSGSVAHPSRVTMSSRGWIAAALAAMGALAIGYFAGTRMSERPSSTPVRRLQLTLGDEAPVALAGIGPPTGWTKALAISPAGDRIVYVAPDRGTTVLRVRTLESDSSVLLAGTEGAYYPFIAPTGDWVAFFAGGYLKKVPITGGSAVVLAKVDRVTGGTWAPDDRLLLFELDGFQMRRVSATGTSVDSVVALDTQFGAPELLPGGTHAVGQLGSGQLALLSLADGTERAITRRGVLPLDSVLQSDLLFGTSPRYLPSGHLVFATGDGDLAALRFDGRTRTGGGEPIVVAAGVRIEAGFGSADYAVADDGTLVYVPGRSQLFVHVGIVRQGGRIDTLAVPRDHYASPRVSRDGAHLAVQVRSAVGGWELYLVDLKSSQRQRIPVDGNIRPFPASWMPGGDELMVGRWDPVRHHNYGAHIQSLKTGSRRRVIVEGASYMSVAPDASGFAFSDWRSGELFFQRFAGDTARRSLPGRGYASAFSPDGRWLAWGDLDGGISASPMPTTGVTYRLAERGQTPLWMPNGDIVYRDGTRYIHLTLMRDGGLRPGRSELYAEGPFLSTWAWIHDALPDGRIVTLLRSPETTAAGLGVVTGFDRHVGRIAQR